ncbi:MAG TPA: tetratricopeptide repeat protein, partial [Pyrinomonadaceae bacterium]|nr:tetratricopeptide repeat protein [Pyrinomonadaceae bacterium]
LNKLDRPDDAARAFENGVGQDSSYRDIKELLGLTYITTEDWDGAKYIFEGLVSTDPKNFKFHYNLALAYRHLGETSPAIEAFERAAQLKPSDAKCHYELGHILVEERRFIEAERELKRLIPLDDRLAKALRTDIDSAKFNY